MSVKNIMNKYEKRVIYNNRKDGRIFDLALNLKQFWDITYTDKLSVLIGTKLVDRVNAKHSVTIIKARRFMGIVMVEFKGGSGLCLDHAIEQFNVKNK